MKSVVGVIDNENTFELFFQLATAFGKDGKKFQMKEIKKIKDESGEQ